MVDFSKLLKGSPRERDDRIALGVHLCILINCCTEQVTEVDLEFYLKYSRSLEQWFVHIIGGPTGFESASLQPLVALVENDLTWYACAGTRERWDTLKVPVGSLKSVVTTAVDKLKALGHT